MRTASRFVPVILLAALALADSGQSAFGSSFTVNSTVDTVDANPGDGVCADADGKCTLRAAVMETNALPGADEINLPDGTYMLMIPPPAGNPDLGPFDAAAGDLDITSDLTITGAGADSTLIDAGGLARIFFVDPPRGTLKRIDTQISGLTVQNGESGDNSGGGIFNWGNLTLTDVMVRASSSSSGGGIANQVGDLTLVRSTVSGNAASAGGGISSQSGGTLTVIASTVSANTATYGAGMMATGEVTIVGSTFDNNDGGFGGGGAEFFSANVSITNSTFTKNSAGCHGGGIWAQATYGDEVHPSQVTFANVTLVDNTSNCHGQGGNISIDAPSVAELKNTLVAYGGVGADCSRPVTSRGHNLDIDGTCGLAGEGDISTAYVLMDPLADNGGPTKTVALTPGGCPSDACIGPNDAVDNGDEASCTSTDQRGQPRPFDGDGDGIAQCDIGAYEMQVGPWTCAPPCNVLFVTATPTPTPTPASFPPSGGPQSDTGRTSPAAAVAVIGAGLSTLGVALLRRRFLP